MSTYALDRDPKRQFFGIGSVILFHAIVIYALVSGLAKKVVDVVRAPIETRVIEEVKPPPPEVKIEPPKLELPPPPFVPPPEVTISQPPPPQPTIAATVPEPPPAKVEIAPPPPPVVEAPPAPPKPAVVAVAVACPKRAEPAYPSRAERDGVAGAVQARLTIRGGKVVGVDIVKSTPRGVFDEAVRKAVLQYACQDNGDREVVATQTFEFVPPS